MTTNEMIYEALTTDSRKKKARWQTELETLGYTIIKDGSWLIRNPKTNKWIRLVYNNDVLHTNHRKIKFGIIYSRSYKTRKNKPLTSINFEGILNSTRDIEYNGKWTDVEIMAQSLSDRKYHQNKLDNAMSEYQQKIEEITKEYQKKLASAKSSYDWNVKYHTDGLMDANKTINKLLKRV